MSIFNSMKIQWMSAQSAKCSACARNAIVMENVRIHFLQSQLTCVLPKIQFTALVSQICCLLTTMIAYHSWKSNCRIFKATNHKSNWSTHSVLVWFMLRQSYSSTHIHWDMKVNLTPKIHLCICVIYTCILYYSV